MATNQQELDAAKAAIFVAEGHVRTCPDAGRRDVACKAMDEARKALARDAVRQAMAWACKAVATACGCDSDAFADMQALYDTVHEMHHIEQKF